MIRGKKTAVCVLLLLSLARGNGQEAERGKIPFPLEIKTNLLYDVTTTLNAGVEVGLAERFSLDVPVSYNPWKFGSGRHWKHFLVQPELRYWQAANQTGHFVGVHGHYGVYNARLPKGLFSDYMASHRFEGWLAGAGVSYGYRWNLTPRLGIEATVGLGYAYIKYDKYPLEECGEKLAYGTYNYFGPTKLGVTLSYTFGKKSAKAKAKPRRVYYQPNLGTDYAENAVGGGEGVRGVKEVKGVKEEKESTTITNEPPHPSLLERGRGRGMYVVPAVEPLKRRMKSGTAYLDFEKGRSDIDYFFGNNTKELRKIHDLIESVLKDPYATVTRIALVGHASPEGVAADNMLLSARRAASLKNHIKVLHSFPETLFTVDGRGEDWHTIDSLAAAGKNIQRYMILEVIRGTADLDQREYRLREEFPDFYERLRYEIYPTLRRTVYEVNYTVLPFTPEIAIEQYRQDPSSLSLNEMFTLAQRYEPGSTQFNEIFETAARLFPESDEANLNAAASALARGDTVGAALYLSKVKKQGEAYFHNLQVMKELKVER